MINGVMRAAVKPKMTALSEEVKERYGAERCGYPYVPMVRESYVEGPRIMICGKGAGSWGLRYAGIEGIGPGSTLADVPEGDWYPEVIKVHEAFIEQGAKKYLSGEKGGYARGAWWRSLYSVVYVFRDKQIGRGGAAP